MATFTFQPRWKEELVCTGPAGTFVLELPMGILSAYLPTEAAWTRTAPPWARDLWPILHAELAAWCGANNAQLIIDDTAGVYEVVRHPSRCQHTHPASEREHHHDDPTL
jgi:hypothetical protein